MCAKVEDTDARACIRGSITAAHVTRSHQQHAQRPSFLSSHRSGDIDSKNHLLCFQQSNVLLSNLILIPFHQLPNQSFTMNNVMLAQLMKDMQVRNRQRNKETNTQRTDEQRCRVFLWILPSLSSDLSPRLLSILLYDSLSLSFSSFYVFLPMFLLRINHVFDLFL